MRRRTKAREEALKILYSIDINKVGCKELLNTFWEGKVTEKEVIDFAVRLVSGTMENLNVIDGLITKYTDNWQLKRMAIVDRNILRIGAFELLFCTETPPNVIINEAVELAKKYGDVDSGKFVNGILDKIHKTEKRCTDI